MIKETWQVEKDILHGSMNDLDEIPVIGKIHEFGLEDMLVL